MREHLSISDEELVRRANGGDGDAFEMMYRRHRDWTMSVAMRFTHDPHESLDVTQDVFLWLMRQFPGFELRAKLRTVLYPVIRNAAFARVRKERTRERHRPAFAASRDGSHEAADPDAAARLADLSRVVESIPEIHREVLYLRYVDDFEIAEIAAVLGIPPGTVKSRLHHALNALRSSDLRKKWYFE